MTKAKVQQIIPLFDNQELLLFNHLNSEIDSGEILVTSDIKGKVEITLFQDALNQLAVQHEVFRMSIQWENLSKSVQVIQKDSEIPFEFMDISRDENISLKLDELRSSLIQQKIPLNRAPISRILLVQIGQEEYKLFWKCHHILFDGISSRIALEQLAHNYKNLAQATPQDIVPSWKQIRSQLNSPTYQKTASEFWQGEFEGFQAKSLVSSVSDSSNKIKSSELGLSMDVFQQIMEQHGLTLNSLIQSIVLLILGKVQSTNKVVLGTVVSGRNLTLPGINNFIGLLANVLPVFGKMEEDQSFVDFAKQTQLHHANARQFENYSLQKIFRSQTWKGNLNLFDCLLVVENFENQIIRSSTFTIENYSSSLTSNYPFTVTVLPDKELKFSVRYDESISDYLVENFLDCLRIIEKELSINSSVEISDLQNSLPHFTIEDQTDSQRQEQFEGSSDQSPINVTELKLLHIWENVLQINPVGAGDNFFQLGGKSIQAVQIFNQIQQVFGKKMIPSIILKYPTVRQLAKQMDTEENINKFKYLIPFLAQTNTEKLFCIHSGGGHVFFYRHLANNLQNTIDVVGIQPRGLDGEEPHKDFKEMASSYIKEIVEFYPVGKVNLLGYCLSSALVLELSKQLQEQGREIGKLIILDSYAYPWYVKYQKANAWSFSSKLKRLFSVDGAKRILQKISPNNHNPEPILDDSPLPKLRAHVWTKFKEYEWESINHEIFLIRSEEYTKSDRGYHVEGWQELTENQLKTAVIDTTHKLLLMPPKVQDLSTLINEYISNTDT